MIELKIVVKGGRIQFSHCVHRHRAAPLPPRGNKDGLDWLLAFGIRQVHSGPFVHPKARRAGAGVIPAVHGSGSGPLRPSLRCAWAGGQKRTAARPSPAEREGERVARHANPIRPIRRRVPVFQCSGVTDSGVDPHQPHNGKNQRTANKDRGGKFEFGSLIAAGALDPPRGHAQLFRSTLNVC